MTWASDAKALERKHRACSSVDVHALRLCLGELWLLLKDAPDVVTSAFSVIHDHALAAEALRFEDHLIHGKLVWTSSGQSADIALSIGAQLRALDSILATRPYQTSFPKRLNPHLIEEISLFVIPRSKPKTTTRNPGPGNSFFRRATPHHRMIPKRIRDSFEIELHADIELTPSAKIEGASLGACLFRGEKHDYNEKGPVQFQNVKAVEESDQIIEQVHGAYSQCLIAAVWPELSMPERRRLHLVKELKRASKENLFQGPAIIVGGSWHDHIDGVLQNLMRIYDRTGRERLTFQKLTQFAGGGLVEANAPGNVIPVLISDDFIITFAICSDFCINGTPPSPYMDLDVDLILVASLGTAAAMNGHKVTAVDHDRRFGSTAFVVQQNENSSAPLGWVLPSAGHPPSLDEDSIWSLR